VIRLAAAPFAFILYIFFLRRLPRGSLTTFFPPTLQFLLIFCILHKAPPTLLLPLFTCGFSIFVQRRSLRSFYCPLGRFFFIPRQIFAPPLYLVTTPSRSFTADSFVSCLFFSSPRVESDFPPALFYNPWRVIYSHFLQFPFRVRTELQSSASSRAPPLSPPAIDYRRWPIYPFADFFPFLKFSNPPALLCVHRCLF